MKDRLTKLVLIIVIAIVYWQWFLPEVWVANDFPLVSKQLLDSLMDLPRTWSEKGAEGLGEYTTFFLWGWPLTFLSGALSRIGLNFALLERLLLLIPILVLAAFGIWRLSEDLKLSNFGKLIASVFYLSNTYIILLIDGGQLSVALAYGFFPISFIAVDRAIKGNLYKKILASFAVAILGFFDFRFIYILLLLILFHFLYQVLFIDRQDRTKWILEYIKSGAVSGLIVLGINAYWLFPLIKAPITSSTYSFFTQTQFISFGNIGHSILLLSPHWFKNVFGNIIPLRFEFIIIPILVFLAPVLRKKDRQIGFWLIVAITAVFLTKGTSEPFGSVYQWLFSNIPGFSLFRDSTKFFVLIAISYSLLLGVTTDEIIKKLDSVSKSTLSSPRKRGSIKIKVNWIPAFTGMTIILYFLFLVRPIFLNQMTGTFSKQPYQDEYSKLEGILEDDKSFSRVFWIPNRAPLGYSSIIHPNEEASRLSQRRPFNVGTRGTYETFNFLREAPYIGEIFNVAGIGYIAYPPLDPRRDNLHPDNIRYYQTFSDQLSSLFWLTKVGESPIHLWKVNTHQDKFFITSNVWWVIGSDNIYNEATKSASLKLSKNGLVFVDEQPGLGRRIDEIPNAKIVLNDKTVTDLAASFIDSSQLIFPAKQLGFEPNKSGWWKRESADLVRWRYFLHIKYGIDNLDFDLGGGWAVGEGNLKFKISNLKLKKDSILLARVLESTRSGEIRFYQDDILVGQINTKNKGNDIRWFEIGKLPKDGESLKITSTGDINVVNTLTLLDKNEWAMYQDKAKKLQGRVVNFDESSAQNDNNQIVTYQKINPTRYRVNISGLTKSAFLVFSQNYDGLWKLNGQTPLPVYSLLNGFKIEKDGEYIVEFEAQKFVYPGLIISFSTIAISIFLLIKIRKSNPS